MNMVAVKWFGEMEFWFSIIKVAALVLFLLIGPPAGHRPCRRRRDARGCI